MVDDRSEMSTIATTVIEMVIKEHPFWDGNHRTAYELGRFICLLFGYRLDVTINEAVVFMREIDDKDVPNVTIKKWLKERAVPMKGR